MKNATQEELKEATENLRRYLKAMFALYRELEERKTKGTRTSLNTV